MNQNVVKLMLALVRSVLGGNSLSDEEKSLYSSEILPELMRLSKKHDIAHLAAHGLTENGLLNDEEKLKLSKYTMTAIYRVASIDYELEQICGTLENAQIPFMPLKGSVLRKYYPEAWMRTSCDIDILVHFENLKQAILCLKSELGFTEKENSTHDVSLFSPGGNHVELHFELVEEDRAGLANTVLQAVWAHSTVKAGCDYQYEMSDEMFCFYHIAHMAKHFEVGGCGVRAFIDLYILDGLPNIDTKKREALLQSGKLLQFALASKKLSKVWLEKEEPDDISIRMQDFIINGGVYGTSSNRVALQQTRKGGRLGYMLSRLFIPYTRLKRYYPILEKHKCLMPIMQVRRWFMLLRPDVARMARSELSANNSMDRSKADEMNGLLDMVGLM